MPALSRIASDAPAHSAKFNTSFVQWNARNVSLVLPRSLWLLGCPREALKIAKKAAEDSIDCLLNWTARDSLLTYARAAVGWQGWLAVLRGDSSRGIESLRAALEAQHEDGYELYRPDMSKALGEALLKTGQWELAYSRIREAIEWCATRLRMHETSDPLQVKG